MYKRVDYAQWTEIVPLVALILIVAVFVVLMIRALRIPKEKADRLAHLPLEEQPEQISRPHER